MNTDHRNEIEQCAAAIAEGTATEQMLQSLAALLEQSEECQDLYAESLHYQLLIQHEISLSRVDFRSLVPAPSVPAVEPDDELSCVSLAALAALDEEIESVATSVASRYRRQNPVLALRLWQSAAVLAASLLVGLAFYHLYGSSPYASQSEVAAVANRPAIADTQQAGDEVVVRDNRALNILSQITRTESLSGIRLSTCFSEQGPPGTLAPCTGTAWLERKYKSVQRGYLVALEPGQQMDITFDAFASSENAVSMIELDAQGQLAGGWTSFNNLYNNDIDNGKRRNGLVGQCSEFNSGDKTRYFLFAGSHLLPGDSVDSNWCQSDCRSRLQTDFMLVIGWDDRVYQSDEETAEELAIADNDYNDMVATIHFTWPEKSVDAVAKTRNQVEFMPAPMVERMQADKIEEGYVLDVRPGQRVVLAVSSATEVQTRIQLLDFENGRIVWRDEGVPFREGDLQTGDRGTFVISNKSDRIHRYVFQTHFHAKKDSPYDAWRTCAVMILAGDKEHAYIGFEDDLSSGNTPDFFDTCVVAHWLDF